MTGLNGHSPDLGDEIGGDWHCTRCGLHASLLAALAETPCPSVPGQIIAAHRRRNLWAWLTRPQIGAGR